MILAHIAVLIAVMLCSSIVSWSVDDQTPKDVAKFIYDVTAVTLFIHLAWVVMCRVKPSPPPVPVLPPVPPPVPVVPPVSPPVPPPVSESKVLDQIKKLTEAQKATVQTIRKVNGAVQTFGSSAPFDSIKNFAASFNAAMNTLPNFE